MGLLYNLLILIVFIGPVGMVAYSLRSKLGLTKLPADAPSRRGEWEPPPLWIVLVWLAALIALLLLPHLDSS